VHMLLEARDHANVGEAVPADMLKNGIAYLQTLAASPASNMDDARVRAYAIYLLTREGVVTTPMLASLRATLDNKNSKDYTEWKSDLMATYMAASYQLLQQPQLANELIVKPIKLLQDSSQEAFYGHYYDDVVRNAQTLYIVSRHFPTKVKELNATALNNIMQPISVGRYNTLSASYALLGFDAYAGVTGNKVAGQMAITTIDKQGKAIALNLPNNIVPTATFGANVGRLKLSGPSGLPMFYAITESGFDIKLPTTALTQGIEIIRDYTDDKGAVIKNVTMGDEINVHVKIRAIDGAIDDVAIVDLLPGGFEPVLKESTAVTESDAEVEQAGDDGCGCSLYMTGWRPFNTDVREDRVIFYGQVNSTITEFTYKIKATNSGNFTVPPAYAESMYNRLLQARSLPSSLIVAKPK
jgi:alpha-2-macroglobulin